MTAQEQVLKNHNVTNLNNASLYSTIQIYLDRAKQRSENTYVNYNRYFDEFFQFVYGVNTAQVTWEDLYDENKLNDDTIESYQLYFCKEKGDAESYINSKVRSVHGLFKYLSGKKQGKNLNLDIFDIESLEEKPNSFDIFSEEEVKNLFEFAKKQYHGNIQNLVFRTFYKTALRRSAVMNLKWSEIYQKVDNDTNKMVWCIVTKNKRNKYPVRPISDDFYGELCSLKKQDTQEDDNVFDINVRTLYNTLDKFCEVYGIDRSKRKIGIHSLRATAGNIANKMYGLKVAQDLLDHSSIATTGNRYLKVSESLTSKPSYLDGKEIDLSVLKGLGEDGLIELIRKCSIVVQNEIAQKAGK
jgi:integrase